MTGAHGRQTLRHIAAAAGFKGAATTWRWLFGHSRHGRYGTWFEDLRLPMLHMALNCRCGIMIGVRKGRVIARPRGAKGHEV